MSFGKSDPRGQQFLEPVLKKIQNHRRGLKGEEHVRLENPVCFDHPEHQIDKNKEVDSVIIKCEPCVPPEHSLRNEKQKQLQDSYAPTFTQMKLAYQQGLLVCFGLNHHIYKEQEVGAVIMKRESLVPPMILEHSLSNEKQKQLQDSFAPTFAQMKLAYQQGLLGSSRFRLQQNSKSLEDLDKETNMSCPGPSVLLSPQPQIANNKEAGAVIVKRESLMKLAYQQGLLGSSRFRLQQNLKSLEDLDKETNMSCPGPSVLPVTHNLKSQTTKKLMKLAYQQGLLGSSGVRLQENPKLLEDLDKGDQHDVRAPVCFCHPDHQIAKNKEVGAVIIQPRIFGSTYDSNNCLRNEKQKQLQDSFAPTFSLMKVLAYRQRAAWFIRSPVHQIANDKEAVVITKRECLVPPISEQSLRKGKQKQIPESFPSTFPQIDLASQLPSVLLMNGPCPPEEAWCCEICNVRPTAGFETSVEVLPRLCKIKFETGMMDELLYMDIPEECYTPSGHIVLNYAKVTEESVHQLKEAIQKFQAFAESSSDIPAEEFQRNSNQFATSIRGLARVMDKSFINDPFLVIPKLCPMPPDIRNSQQHERSNELHQEIRDRTCRIHHQIPAASSVANNSVAGEGPQPYYDDAISQNFSVISFAPYPSRDEGPGEPVLNQRISTVLPSTTIRPLVVQPSAADIVLRANTMSIEPNKYLSSKVKAEPDLDTSQNLAAAKADALTDTQVLDQNLENLNGASLFPGIHIGAPLTGGLVVNNTHSNSQQSNDQLPCGRGEIDPIDDIQFD
ncbi:hypothetical protein HAX54_042598 [Datura stramonium]|uniref:Uncharacterized protein n=1 Tax=Datura stramonium TaxID=4076 RepID=A0ABS8RS83_DATST|nr:hypothetical protein [Datura stramonium]